MMARKPKAIVLDSWSVIAYLEDEPAGQQVADLIAEAHENSTPIMMTVVNVGEVWYIVARETSIADADQSVAELKGLGIDFVEAGWKLTREAAAFKAKHKMSYADCFAAALAKEHKADLVTGDPEFRQIDGEIKIAWVH